MVYTDVSTIIASPEANTDHIEMADNISNIPPPI